ncbi:hypothetical protein DW019_11060 [Clostridium sp. AF37-5]|jgi:hypothetical protein|uniref:hypothetical protein n=1 Tax=Clostridium sp. AF37-5 TaxID=2293016 RepID=UPI000E52A57A|nr:hypothetical protein [Clostridium sp. AF37-5]RHO95784.1 hypothetical protein DW019_11060 [Clostridium sp. AF37-5]
MQKNNIIANAKKEIENFEDKLGENFYDAIQEDDNLTIDMARGILHAFSDCKTEREFQVANNMLIGVCGYSIQTLIERIKELDEDQEHYWRWENDF